MDVDSRNVANCNRHQDRLAVETALLADSFDTDFEQSLETQSYDPEFPSRWAFRELHTTIRSRNIVMEVARPPVLSATVHR